MGTTVVVGSKLAGLSPSGEASLGQEARDTPGASQGTGFGEILAGAGPGEDGVSEPKGSSPTSMAPGPNASREHRRGDAHGGLGAARLLGHESDGDQPVADKSEDRGPRSAATGKSADSSRKPKASLPDAKDPREALETGQFTTGDARGASGHMDAARPRDSASHDLEARGTPETASQHRGGGTPETASQHRGGGTPETASQHRGGGTPGEARGSSSSAANGQHGPASKDLAARTGRVDVAVEKDLPSRQGELADTNRSGQAGDSTSPEAGGTASKRATNTKGSDPGLQGTREPNDILMRAEATKGLSSARRSSGLRRPNPPAPASSRFPASLEKAKPGSTPRALGPRNFFQGQPPVISQQPGGVNEVHRGSNGVSGLRGTDGQESTSESLVFQVGTAVQGMRAAGDGTYLLNLRLEPPELGVVRVTVGLHDGEVVSIRLAPVEGATHDLLLDLLGDLKQDLARQQGSNVLVELAGSGQERGSSRGAQSREPDIRSNSMAQGSEGKREISPLTEGLDPSGASSRSPLGANGRGMWVDLRL